MTATLRPFTFSDLLQMPEDLFRYEILDGELIASPAPPAGHHRVHMALLRIIDDHARQTQAGEVILGPFYVVFGRYDAVQPDLIFVSASRPRVPHDATSISFAPDVIVEVTSPLSKRIDLVRKMALYARGGAPEYWVADPWERAFAINVLEGQAYTAVTPDASGRLTSPALAGLRVDPTAVFASLD